MTQAPSLIGLFVAPLNRTGIDYMVTGGLAAVVYGHPRLTLDVDLVMRLSSLDAATFVSLWPPDQFYSPPLEVVEEECARSEHGHFNVIHAESMMRADVYLAGRDDLTMWALEHRVEKRVEGIRVQFAPIEYVVVNKLRYFQMGGSDRHLRDVARMLEISRSEVDQPILETWISRLELDAEWARALTYSEPE